MASTRSTATGMSATCSGVRWWKIDTTGPHGMIAKPTNAGAAATIGATKNTSLSTPVGTMSSLSGSLSASAIGCRSPHGPARLGPGRFCMRPITRRSNQIMKMVVSSRNANTIPTFSSTIHQMTWSKSLSVGSAASTFIPPSSGSPCSRGRRRGRPGSRSQVS